LPPTTVPRSAITRNHQWSSPTLAREVLKNFFWCVTLGIGFIVDALVMLLGDDEGRSVTDRLIGSRIVNSPPS